MKWFLIDIFQHKVIHFGQNVDETNTQDLYSLHVDILAYTFIFLLFQELVRERGISM